MSWFWPFKRKVHCFTCRKKFVPDMDTAWISYTYIDIFQRFKSAEVAICAKCEEEYRLAEMTEERRDEYDDDDAL